MFSRPDRVSGDELRWLNEYYRVNTTRVVTVAYYSLVKLDSRLIACAADKGARWFDVESVNRLAMDHKTILAQALEMLNRQLMTEPVRTAVEPVYAASVADAVRGYLGDRDRQPEFS